MSKPVPAIIDDLVGRLMDQRQNMFVRENTAAMLEAIRDKVNNALAQFANVKTKARV
jgi:hypothetical protein